MAGLLLATSCRKDDPIACPTLPPPVTPVAPSPPTSDLSLAEFTRRYSPRPQYYYIYLGKIQTINTLGGAKLTFPANYFNLPNGTPARDSASLRVLELYTVPDMVLADMPTRPYGTQNLLISSGEFNIQVQQLTTRLVPSSSASSLPVLLVPKLSGQDSTQRQQLWQQPVTQGMLQGWQTSAAYPAVQTVMKFYRATIPADSVGWWSIAQPWAAYDTPYLPTITIATPATTAGETRVYVRPVGATGLLRLVPTSNDETHWQATLPLGATMQIIVLQSVGGQLYFGAQQFIVQSGRGLMPNVFAVSETDAVRFIRQL